MTLDGSRELSRRAKSEFATVGTGRRKVRAGRMMHRLELRLACNALVRQTAPYPALQPTADPGSFGVKVEGWRLGRGQRLNAER